MSLAIVYRQTHPTLLSAHWVVVMPPWLCIGFIPYSSHGAMNIPYALLYSYSFRYPWIYDPLQHIAWNSRTRVSSSLSESPSDLCTKRTFRTKQTLRCLQPELDSCRCASSAWWHMAKEILCMKSTFSLQLLGQLERYSWIQLTCNDSRSRRMNEPCYCTVLI